MHHALLDLNQPFSAALTCEPVAMSHGRNSWVKVWILDKIQNATVGLAKLRLVSCFTIFDWIDIPEKGKQKDAVAWMNREETGAAKTFEIFTSLRFISQTTLVVSPLSPTFMVTFFKSKSLRQPWAFAVQSSCDQHSWASRICIGIWYTCYDPKKGWNGIKRGAVMPSSVQR